MLDIVILAVLGLALALAVIRARAGSWTAVLPAFVAGALLASFVMWWYVLGPLALG